MINVGLLDGQTIQAVIFAKELKKSGYRVTLFCDTKLSYGYHTRHAKFKVLCPSTQHETSKFHSFFLNYLKTEKLDVIIPMNDHSAKYLSENKEVLKNKVAFTIPDFEIFMKGYDKNKLMKICNNYNFPHPKTIDLLNFEKGSKIADFKFPGLIKPNETTGARGFVLVNSLDELWANYEKVYKEFGACHLQEFIPAGGMQYKVQILIYNNKVVNSTVIEKIRFYPVNGGSSCFNKTIINNELVLVCTEVLKSISWEGFADFDLIEDPRDGIIKIMEINPRVPACIKASIISGVDFVNSIVNVSLNKKCEKSIYKSGKYLRYFSMDVLWLLSNNYKRVKLGEWFKDFFSKNHYFQDFDLFDPMPFIIGSYAGLKKQLNPQFRVQKKGMN